jgi:DNA-binding transcriptional LysR family regulator
MMTLNQLRILVAISKQQHLTYSAKDLCLMQPLSSVQLSSRFSLVVTSIASLEAGYRQQLFQRIGRRIELTDAGRLLVQEATKILDRIMSAKLALKELSRFRCSKLNIGVSRTVTDRSLSNQAEVYEL